MRKPKALRAGDRVAVVAPASHCSRDEFDRGVAELTRLQFLTTFDQSVFDRATFTAGTPSTRAQAFVSAWRDPDVKAIVAVRGGYGSVELLPTLARELTDAEPKMFVGYSDTTSLLSWLTCQLGVPALHGPMIDGRLAQGTSAYDEGSLLALLQGGSGLVLRPDGLHAVCDGEASGPVYGGTLTQLTASLGTPFAFDPPAGAVLFIEDVNERPYRLHRMLTQLRLAGILSRASGLLIGEMRGCDEPDGRVRALDVVEMFAGEIAGPVVAGFPSGHTSGACWTLPLGVRCRLETRPVPSLLVEESPVE